MALKGIRVLELSGLAPSPVCGMILSDFGACVTRVDKVVDNQMDVLRAGKRTISLNLKKPEAIEILKKLAKTSDVLVEPYRPGKMEKLGIGPDVLLKENPRLIYARLTGFGSDGRGVYADRAGHDINYLAVSGLLSMFGRKGERPIAPVNLAADFAGGGLMCAFGICVALLERYKSGKGQVVDCSMVEGAAYVGSWLFRSRSLPVWGQPRGENLLDTGHHCYDTYETKDGKFMSVGALEPQFYAELLKGLGLDPEVVQQFGDCEKNRKMFSDAFKTKTQSEWCEIFDFVDACTFPVLDYDEAPMHQHNLTRQTFVNPHKVNGIAVPNPAPQLSRTPAKSRAHLPERDTFEMAHEILSEIGFKKENIIELYESKTLLLNGKPRL